MASGSNFRVQTASGLALKKLSDLLDGHDAVPDSLTIGMRTVVLDDLVNAITAFREQFRILESTSKEWPSARLVRTKDGQQIPYWSPIDLRDLGGESDPDHDKLLHEIWSGIAQARARARVNAFGLFVADRPSSEAKKAFTEMLSEILGKRHDATTANSGTSPPNAPFEVTTNSQGIEVVVADGFFFSTVRGFGYSSPAHKALPFGNYVFGYTTHTGPDFCSGTLWSVPADSRAHLNV